MVNTPSKNPTGTNIETPPNNEILELELKSKISELWLLEVEIFKWDGKIGADSNDTDIDKEYDRAMKDATDIKSKIEIVKKLLSSFRVKNEDINVATAQHKESWYLDEQWKKNIDNFTQSYNSIIKKYPWYQKHINDYFKIKLDIIDGYINIVKDTINMKYINAVVSGNYKGFSDDIIEIEKNIEWLAKIKEIKNKEDFFWYFWRNNLFPNVSQEWLEVDLVKLFSIGFISQWFSDQVNFDDERYFKYGTLWVLMEIWTEKVNKINELYKDPNKKEELIKLLESFPLHQKNRLLEIKVFKDILLEGRKKELWLWDIKNTPVITKILSSISYLSNKVDITNIKLIVSKLLKKEIDINDFIHSDDFKNMMKSATHVDAFYLCSIFKNIASVLERVTINTCTPLGEEIENIYKNILTWITDDLKNYKKQLEANRLDEKLWYFNAKMIELGVKLDDPNSINSVIMKYPNFAQEIMNLTSNHANILTIKPPEPPTPEKIPEKAEPTLSEYNRQKMQARLSGLWVWEKELKIDEKTWKLVNAVDPGKPFKKDIWHGKQIKLTVDGELILVNSLWYKMKYENNSTWMEKALETAETFDYMNKIWFGYFWTNLPDMLKIIKGLWIGKAAYMNINENKWDFLSIKELHDIVIPIFEEIWFINKPLGQDISEVQEMNDLDMFSLIAQVEVDGVHYWSAFQKWKPFRGDYFKEFLIKKNKV